MKRRTRFLILIIALLAIPAFIIGFLWGVQFAREMKAAFGTTETESTQLPEDISAETGLVFYPVTGGNI